MAITIPIISEFNGKGIQKAIKQFKQLETNGQKAMFVLKNGAKAAAAGFLALGAAAAAAAVVGLSLVKDAMEDAKSQRQLALALKAATGARAADIKANEKWIATTSRALGIADDKLRPALARFVRSTHDAEKAQRLLNLALNISAATGKPLENVVAALGRAYDGNNTALGRLGLGLDKAYLKGHKFAEIQKTLEDNFKGAAAGAANTYEGRMARLQTTFKEMKESLGYVLLPIFDKVAAAVLRISDAFGEKGLTGAIQQAKRELSYLFYDENGKLNQFGENINKVMAFFNNTVGGGSKLASIASNFFTLHPGNVVKGTQEFFAGQYGTSLLAPAASAQDRGLNILGAGRYGTQQGITVNINMGVGDPVAVGRNVANVLRQYDRRTGGK
jgi:hypothetical protein